VNRMRTEIEASAVGPVHKQDAHTVLRLYRFSESFAGFSGHFPGQPVLPAFVQILTGLSLVAEMSPGMHDLAGIADAKFYLPIRPDTVVQVACHDLTEGPPDRYRIRLTVADRIASAFDLITSRRGST
jgi:3-hydroxyacyl-[acyl-carrier-protein] dehydratase